LACERYALRRAALLAAHAPVLAGRVAERAERRPSVAVGLTPNPSTGKGM